jgi:hypothetical protein
MLDHLVAYISHVKMFLYRPLLNHRKETLHDSLISSSLYFCFDLCCLLSVLSFLATIV